MERLTDLGQPAMVVLVLAMSVRDFRQRHTRRFRPDQIRAVFIASVFFAAVAVLVVLTARWPTKAFGLLFGSMSVNWWIQARIAHDAAASGGST